MVDDLRMGIQPVQGAIALRLAEDGETRLLTAQDLDVDLHATPSVSLQCLSAVANSLPIAVIFGLGAYFSSRWSRL